jgi:hypothetical protein
MAVRDDILRELDGLIDEGRRMLVSFKIVDWGIAESSANELDLQAFAASGIAALDRIAGRDSEFYRQLSNKPKRLQVMDGEDAYLSALVGSLVALRRAVEGGLLIQLERQVRANVYDDFLVQAQELLDSGYHVAAMVLIGGVLEDRLCKLCAARGIAWTGAGSLTKYNDLLRSAVYDQPTWRRIQAIGDVRNQAAHGAGASVKVEDVADAHRYVGRFLADHPG